MKKNKQNEHVIACLKDIKEQNAQMLKKLDDQDIKIDQLTKKAMVSGAVAGGVSGSIIAVSIEFIKAKLGM